MSESARHSLNAVHPAEGKCIQRALIAGTPDVIDCSDYLDRGVMVRIFNSSAAILGYKFSASNVANIDVNATSGAQCCNRIAANSFERGFVPFGKPYLHVVGIGAGGNLYISDASDIR